MVMNLVKDLLMKGRIVFTDNFFTSTFLAEWLYRNRTFLVGTIRSNRRGLPNLLMQEKLPVVFYDKIYPTYSGAIGKNGLQRSSNPL